MEVYILLNVAAIIVFYVLFGQTARQYNKRITEANVRLQDNTVDPSLHTEFSRINVKATATGQMYYWIATATILLLMFIGFSIYARLVEPEASLIEWIIIPAILYGVGFCGCLIVLSFVITRVVQVAKLNQYVDSILQVYPRSTVISEVKELIRPRVSEVGLSGLSLVAVVASIIMGLAAFVIFYSVAQTAIECARSSKCI